MFRIWWTLWRIWLGTGKRRKSHTIQDKTTHNPFSSTLFERRAGNAEHHKTQLSLASPQSQNTYSGTVWKACGTGSSNHITYSQTPMYSCQQRCSIFHRSRKGTCCSLCPCGTFWDNVPFHHSLSSAINRAFPFQTVTSLMADCINTVTMISFCTH